MIIRFPNNETRKQNPPQRLRCSNCDNYSMAGYLLVIESKELFLCDNCLERSRKAAHEMWDFTNLTKSP